MTVCLYRRNLSLTSGAGQLIRMQADELRSRGAHVVVMGQRGTFSFRLRTRHHVTRAVEKVVRSADPSTLIVDHGPELRAADVVFIHNVMAEALRHRDRPEWRVAAQREAMVLGALHPGTQIVANSGLAKRGLVDRYGFEPERIKIIYPGFDEKRFSVESRSRRRESARRDLGLVDTAPLFGFVTSGDFDKRGLDVFVAAAERIAARDPDACFLVVGSRRLPDWTRRHPLVASRRLQHRPKSRSPERWFAALDVFLYPAYFEEYGLVVAEAAASGLPILTSRCVGAAECLPPRYARWLLDAPDAGAFADQALALWTSETERRELSRAGTVRAADFSRRTFVSESLDLFEDACVRKRAALSCSDPSFGRQNRRVR